MMDICWGIFIIHYTLHFHIIYANICSIYVCTVNRKNYNGVKIYVEEVCTVRTTVQRNVVCKISATGKIHAIYIIQYIPCFHFHLFYFIGYTRNVCV